MDGPSLQKPESRQKRAITIALLFAVSLWTYQYFSGSSSPPSSPGTVEPGISPSPVLGVPPAQVRTALADAYRLKPDRRFLLAVTEVARFVSGSAQPVEAKFENGGWTITSGGNPVCTLPELPDFHHMVEALARWSLSQAQLNRFQLISDSSEQRDPAIEALLVEFHAPQAAQAARILDQRWNSGDRRSSHLKSALRALVLLNLQSLDLTETSDLLPSKALALLALTKGLTSHPVAREETLLAEIMSYNGHAVRLARTLLSDDPVRHYVSRQDGELLTLAEHPAALVETRYLWFLRLADRQDSDEVYRWKTRHFSANASPAALKPSLLRNRLGLHAVVSVLREHGLKARDDKYTGPLLDPTTHASYYKGHFYSGLYVLGLDVLDSSMSAGPARILASVFSGTQKLTDLFRTTPSGAAENFQRWYHHLVQSEAGKADPAQLFQDLSHLTHLGFPPLRRTYEEQKKFFTYGGPEMSRSVKVLASRMDTRPSHRVFLGDIVWASLHDVGLAEKLFASLLDTSPYASPLLQAWFAGFTGDKERLFALLRDPRLVPEAKFKALEILEKQFSASPEVLRPEYDLLVQFDPRGWDSRKPYVEYLERLHDYAAARQIIEDWLSSHDRKDGFPYILARTALARTYQGEGQFQAGLDAVGPVLDSGQSGAMERAATLLYKLNRTGEAITLAQKVVHGYPDLARARALLAELFWRQGQHGKAAEVFRSAPYPITPLEWNFTIGPRFAGVFASQPKEQGLAAFSALVAAGLSPGDLVLLTFPVADAKNHELAFLMSSQLREPGFDRQLIVLLYAYRHLKKWKNEQAALDWLRPQVPLHLRGFAGANMYQRKERELVWTLIEPSDEKGHEDFVWLMRTAAFVSEPARFEPYRAQLFGHYSTKANGVMYDTLGRYLLDLVPEEAVLPLITNGETLCETGYHLGLHHQVRGQYYQAAEWYRVVLETGMIRNPEYHWAYDQMNDWYLSGKSLKRLSEERPAP